MSAAHKARRPANDAQGTAGAASHIGRKASLTDLAHRKLHRNHIPSATLSGTSQNVRSRDSQEFSACKETRYKILMYIFRTMFKYLYLHWELKNKTYKILQIFASFVRLRKIRYEKCKDDWQT